MPRERYRVQYVPRGHLVDPRDPPQAFRYVYAGAPLSIQLLGESRPGDANATWVNLCRAEIDMDVPESVLKGLIDLAERHVPAHATDLEPRFIASLLDADGLLRSDSPLPVRFLPVDVKEFVTDIERILFTHARRTVAVGRWRLGIPGPHQPLIEESRFIALGGTWKPLPFYVPSPQWVTT